MGWTAPKTFTPGYRINMRPREIGINALLVELLGGWTLPLIGRRYRRPARGGIVTAAMLNHYMRDNLAEFGSEPPLFVPGRRLAPLQRLDGHPPAVVTPTLWHEWLWPAEHTTPPPPRITAGQRYRLAQASEDIKGGQMVEVRADGTVRPLRV